MTASGGIATILSGSEPPTTESFELGGSSNSHPHSKFVGWTYRGNRER